MTLLEMTSRLQEYCGGKACCSCKLRYEKCGIALYGRNEQEIKRQYCLVFGDSEIATPDQKLKADAKTETCSQAIKADAGKPRLSLVPMQILWDVAAVRDWATANKYPDPESWRKVEISRYRDALLRHTLRYIANPDGLDEESGLPHLYHVATNVAFLAELEKQTKAYPF